MDSIDCEQDKENNNYLRFFVVVVADSTAVLFLHGLFSSSSFWFDTNLIPRMSDEIKAQHRILAPDLLGCGRSPRPVDCAYTVADHIQALEKSIIQRHGLESFHLVAHSMGCIFALVLAAKYPDRVRSITLIAPVYPPGDFDETGKLAQLPCASIFGYLQPFTVLALAHLLKLILSTCQFSSSKPTTSKITSFMVLEIWCLSPTSHQILSQFQQIRYVKLWYPF